MSHWPINWTPGELSPPAQRINDLERELALWQQNSTNWKLENDELEAKLLITQQSAALLQDYIKSYELREQHYSSLHDKAIARRDERIAEYRRDLYRSNARLWRMELHLLWWRAACVALAITCAILICLALK